MFVQGNAGQQIEVIRPMGLYADLVADVLRLSDCESRVEAYSVLEALRLGAAEVLDMEVEDLQVLVIGRPGATSVKGLLYDPMPGGSGLLQQMVERWPEVAAQAMHIVTGCAGQCATSCIDCLQHFRNAFYHRHLDRHVARAALEAWGSALHFGHDIPPRMPEPPDHDGPVNEGERTLQWHLEWAGFPPGEYKHRIDLGGRYGATTPDVFYVDPTGRTMGFCVYKDGLSDRVHGNPERRRIDGQIRDELDAMGYDVLVVSETDLSEREAMHRFFRKLGRRLMDQAELRNLEQRWGVPESST
ncbi:MAG: DUF1998 domain-containing protein [Deltaproteobacteria bacterium]|nr:DUF1998 domain-containing protein [Deltaproteobacteria bacterium]